MSYDKELKYDSLKIKCDFDKLFLMSKKYNGIFPGNEEALEMINTVLELDSKRHLFLCAAQGVYTEKFLVQILKEKLKTDYLFDWCYVYNFDNSDNPKAIKVKYGKGSSFKKEVESTVINIINEVKTYLSGKEIKAYEKEITEEIISKSEIELENLKKEAKEMGFSTHISEKGVFFIPIIDGKKVTEKEYDELKADKQEIIINDLDTIEKRSKVILEKIENIKNAGNAKVIILKNKIIEETTEKNFSFLVNEYQLDEEISYYIVNMKRSLINHLIKCQDKDDNEFLNKFRVNYLGNKDSHTLPIIFADKISYYELFGKIEYSTEQGAYTTDFNLIKPGLLHKANGGYLIINIKDLVSNKLIWDQLKKCLITKKINYENIREQLGAIPITTIDPEPVDLDLKVIIIGSEQVYQLLYQMDTEFIKLFPYHIVVEDTADFKDENVSQIISYIKNESISDTAIEQIIEYGRRITGNKNKITLKLSEYEKIIEISMKIAELKGGKVIQKEHVLEGERKLMKLYYHYQKVIDELIGKDYLIIEVDGKKVGQINGLSVLQNVDFEAARPVRITATAYAGEEGVISLEKENKLNGKIFGKGFSIIKGYLNSLFGKEKAIGINCLVCFEQTYGQIEGDSALCAETYAILSSLSNIPIKQSIAITGSMDQFGNVQPVGSVSKKIEGFYNVCKKRGLTKGQGVVVPSINVDEILLPEEIMESIHKGDFHIYGVSNIEECSEILMDKSFEEVKNIISNKY
jgi:lon-related putative ATP-dependent protease